MKFKLKVGSIEIPEQKVSFGGIELECDYSAQEALQCYKLHRHILANHKEVLVEIAEAIRETYFTSKEVVTEIAKDYKSPMEELTARAAANQCAREAMEENISTKVKGFIFQKATVDVDEGKYNNIDEAYSANLEQYKDMTDDEILEALMELLIQKEARSADCDVPECPDCDVLPCL